MTWDSLHILSTAFGRLGHYIQLRAESAKEPQQ